MPNEAVTFEVGGVRVYRCADEGPAIAGEQDAVDLIGETYFERPDWIAIPVSRLDGAFFDLKTRIAGGILQKLTTYGLRVAILGEIPRIDESRALADFVRESNRGDQVWFVADADALARRLEARGT